MEEDRVGPEAGPRQQPGAPGEQAQGQRYQRPEQHRPDGEPDVLAEVAHNGGPVVGHVRRVEPGVRRLVRGSHRCPRGGRRAQRTQGGRAVDATAARTSLRTSDPAGDAPENRLEGVSKVYADGTVGVAELDLTFAAGELSVLVGPSGCGKTTTMKMINRIIEPTTGRILLGGEDVTRVDPDRLRRRVGYVIQSVGLFPHQTVRTNVGTVPRLLGWDKRRIRQRVDELLQTVGLDPATFGDRYPAQLSGGQRQRAGVARALAADPAVLLMDEPFSAVDPVVRDRLQSEFLRLQDTVRKTIVFVTHDIEEAVRLGDRIAVMSHGGHVEQYATPAELLGRPEIGRAHV